MLAALCLFGLGAVLAYGDLFSAGRVLFWLLWFLTLLGVLITVVIRGIVSFLKGRNKQVGLNVVAAAVLVLPFIWPIYGWLRNRAFITLNSKFISEFAERSEASGEKFANFTLKDSGFAGYNSFTELVFDPSGEIEKPIQDRSPSWNAMVAQKNNLLLTATCSTSLLKVREHVYLAETVC